MIKLSDYVFKFLKNYGIKNVFMLAGGGAMHLCDSLGRSGIEYICCLHEQVAAISALAYAQYKNDIGVALVTTGPGGTNAITGVAAAWFESVPLLVISGQVKTSDFAENYKVRMLGFQETNIVKIVKSITKYAITVTEPNEIKYHLEKAIFLAKEGRPGPVWLDIPLDIQNAKVDEKKLKSFKKPKGENNKSVKILVNKIFDMLNNSERPVILAGYGIRISNSVEKFNKLVKILKIPVLTTWKAADIIEDENPYFFGRPGIAGQRAANFIIQNSDLLISIGARMDYGQIGYEHTTFAREAKKIIIDVDKNEIKKFKFNVDLKIPYDCGKVINEMLNKKIKLRKYSAWLEYGNELKKQYPVISSDIKKSKNYISTYILAEELSKNMNNNDIFAPGSSGMCSDIPMQVWHVKKGQRIINSPGFGAMGFGIPTTIGVCVASGRKNTICTNGDGGFQLNIQDLETIRRLNLPIKFFVLNNKGYGSIRNTQLNFFNGFFVGSEKGSGLTLPEIKRIAYAYKIKYYFLKKYSELTKIVKKVLKEKGPVICEVLTDPDEKTIYRLTSAIDKQGKIRSKPLEDLHPFLPRNEFLKNMIIKPID